MLMILWTTMKMMASQTTDMYVCGWRNLIILCDLLVDTAIHHLKLISLKGEKIKTKNFFACRAFKWVNHIWNANEKKKSNLPEASLYSLHVPFTELDRKKSIFDFFSTQIQMNERAAFRNEQKRRETRDSV